MSPTEFLPVRNFARSAGLGIIVEDIVLREPVTARPANHPTGLEVIQQNMTKQIT